MRAKRSAPAVCVATIRAIAATPAGPNNGRADTMLVK